MQKKIKVVELFAGVGGFRLGLEGWKGKSASSSYREELDSIYEVVWSNQWEPATKTQHTSMVYENRWGTANHSNRDIATVEVADIPNHDLLVGGFPYQDYSVATSLKNSRGLAGKKGVLIIDYMTVPGQTFGDSSFGRKNARLLLVFYLHREGMDFMDYPVHIVDEWNFPEADKNVIRQDWEFIKAKIEVGRAHELSEGDTYYLGACTKGADKNQKREQPRSSEPAMQRAFSLKPGYLNHILASIVGNKAAGYGKVIPALGVKRGETIEDAIMVKFRKYYGRTVGEIQDTLGVELRVDAKNFYSGLCKRIGEFEEIDKSGITVKTVVLPEGDGPPKESISFPAFEYNELVGESWEDSVFRQMLEGKFLFVFFQHDGRNVVLRRVKLWNMPHEDIEEAKKVWDKTREIVTGGNIVRRTGKPGLRKTNFPHKDFNTIVHVRPHATTTEITYPLPVADRLTGAREYTRHSFWLNNTYVLERIYRDPGIRKS